jgi:hypothetical protein
MFRKRYATAAVSHPEPIPEPINATPFLQQIAAGILKMTWANREMA